MDHSKNLHSWPLHKFHILANSRVFKIWTIPGVSHYQWVHVFNIMGHSKTLKLRIIQEFSHFRLLKNCLSFFWKLQNFNILHNIFFNVIDHSGSLKFRTIPEILHLDLSRIFITVKYTPLPSEVPSGFALGNSFRRRGIFDRISPFLF